MRKLLLAFALSTASLSAEIIQLSPMHEEDPHFIHYRCLMIDGSIHRIESIFEQINCDEMCKEELLMEIKSIKFNLGYPTDFEQ